MRMGRFAWWDVRPTTPMTCVVMPSVWALCEPAVLCECCAGRCRAQAMRLPYRCRAASPEVPSTAPIVAHDCPAWRA
jgi:hypothetical protein